MGRRDRIDIRADAVLTAMDEHEAELDAFDHEPTSDNRTRLSEAEMQLDDSINDLDAVHRPLQPDVLGIYWRLFNAPYSAHAGGRHWTRIHLARRIWSGYELAPRTLCGQPTPTNAEIVENPTTGVCKRCRKLAS